ncbi:MAG: flippase [bacterium]
MEEPTSKKVIRNTLYNYLAVVSLTVVRFVSMPVIVHGLGDDRYGIYAAVLSVVGYVGLLDLGIGLSLTKFVAEYAAKKDDRGLSELLSTALILYIVLGLAGAAGLVASSGFLTERFFRIPQDLWGEARGVLWISAVSLFNGLTLGIFGNLLNGLQRQDVSRLISIGNTLVTYSGAILLIRLGLGLVGFVLFCAVVDLASFVLQMAVAKRMVPSLPFFPRHFNVRRMREILNFSFAMLVNQLAVRNMGSLDKLILGLFLPIRYVTLYTVGFTLTSFCFRLPAAAVLASMPAASELRAQQRDEAVQELVLRGIKYTGLLAVPVFTLVGVLAPPLVRLWMGEGYEQSARVVQLLMAGYFWLVLASSGMSVMVGIGKPYVNTFYAVAQIVLCTGLSVLMVRWYGLLGAAAGSGTAYCLGGIAYLVHSTFIFGLSPARLVNRKVLGKIVLLLLPGLALAAFCIRHPAQGLGGILVQSALYGLIYTVLVVRYLVDDYDMAKMAAVMPAVRHLSLLRQ